MRLRTEIVEHTRGQLCPACCCTDRIKNKGILVIKKGRYGSFLSCNRYPNCKYSCKEGNLYNKASKLLNRKR